MRQKARENRAFPSNFHQKSTITNSTRPPCNASKSTHKSIISRQIFNIVKKSNALIVMRQKNTQKSITLRQIFTKFPQSKIERHPCNASKSTQKSIISRQIFIAKNSIRTPCNAQKTRKNRSAKAWTQRRLRF